MAVFALKFFIFTEVILLRLHLDCAQGLFLFLCSGIIPEYLVRSQAALGLAVCKERLVNTIISL